MASESLQDDNYNVNEAAFWHTNMDLYYGFQPGEVVEVEHESNKYWLATIEYNYRHLILLRWLGNYGDFWVDTSIQNQSSSSNLFSSSIINNPKRLFPLGYHLQSQLKSQFKLEQPTKVLIKPSLYNPEKDPYSSIRSVDDLLKLDIDERTNDVFGQKSDHQDAASIVIAKCKAKIDFGQDDVDELEAALQNLNEIDSKVDNQDNFITGETQSSVVEVKETTKSNLETANETTTTKELEPSKSTNNNFKDNLNTKDDVITLSSSSNITTNAENNEPDNPKTTLTTKKPSATVKSDDVASTNSTNDKLSDLNKAELDAKFEIDIIDPVQYEDCEIENNLELCRKLQESAINSGRHAGIDSNSSKIFFLKPKLFFDIGGANHERLFLPGTLLEVCHTVPSPDGLQLCHWFAIVIENLGGRLRLKWFLCDEPKFKQGRLELKTCKSKLVTEEELDQKQLQGDDDKLHHHLQQQQPSDSDTSDKRDQDVVIVNNNNNETVVSIEGQANGLSLTSSSSITSSSKHIVGKNLEFFMHFCNPCIHSIGHVKSSSNSRPYRLPKIISSSISEHLGEQVLLQTEKAQIDHVFDVRRMNLDKDRPLIDHLLSNIRWVMPKYVDIVFAPIDKESRREVLISSPKLTKLIRGFIAREIETGVFEVHSEPNPETGESELKFVHPYDSSYAILPTTWSLKNEECLSSQCSRTPSPPIAGPSSECTPNDGKPASSQDHKRVTDQKEVEVEAQATVGIIEDSKANETSETKAVIVSEQAPKLVPCEASKLAVVDDNSDKTGSITTTTTSIAVKRSWTLMCEIPKINISAIDEEDAIQVQSSNVVEETKDPSYWARLARIEDLRQAGYRCVLDETSSQNFCSKFKLMNELELVHPSSDMIICAGRIRKVAYPLLWIQISPDWYTVLPFNSTNILPSGWCARSNHQLINLLPTHIRPCLKTPSSKSSKTGANKQNNANTNNSNSNKKRKKVKLDHPSGGQDVELLDLDALDEMRHHRSASSLMNIEYILNQKSSYIRIYFNHKCFTGPSLSKGKICSLPQYVGPGPMQLVIQEVVTKVISVAYVPPRILNDLSSKTFEQLLVERSLTNTVPMEFKAKYQKRVHREDIQVCISAQDVALYCECICEHLKCCYNLFGPNLYDGDDCPGHCRALTKSNKFMKRATYYREKARLGEFIGNNDSTSTGGGAGGSGSSKKANTKANAKDDLVSSTSKASDGAKPAASSKQEPTTSRPRYGGRDSSGSGTSSTSSGSSSARSRSDNLHASRQSSVVGEPEHGPSASVSGSASARPASALSRDNLFPVEEHEPNHGDESGAQNALIMSNDEASNNEVVSSESADVAMNDIQNSEEDDETDIAMRNMNSSTRALFNETTQLLKSVVKCLDPEYEFSMFNPNSIHPEDWTVDDVGYQLDCCHLGKFKKLMRCESVDGQALLLLDGQSIREHFENQTKWGINNEDMGKLARFVEFLRSRWSYNSLY